MPLLAAVLLACLPTTFVLLHQLVSWVAEEGLLEVHCRRLAKRLHRIGVLEYASTQPDLHHSVDGGCSVHFGVLNWIPESKRVATAPLMPPLPLANKCCVDPIGPSRNDFSGYL